MGKFIPVTVAFLLLVCGIQIFREPNNVGTGPLVATYIFIVSSYLLLWDMRLYPRSLRMLWSCCQCIVEKLKKNVPKLTIRNFSLLEIVQVACLLYKYFIATFIFENILIDFWFPLEIVAIECPAKLANGITSTMGSGGWECPPWLCDFLMSDKSKLFVSYGLSVFFLIAVLQATRAIDLRELECGFGPFFSDIVFRIQRGLKKTGRSLGFGKKRRVKIRESRKRCKKSISKCHSNKNPCLAEDDSVFGEDTGECMDKDYEDELRQSYSDFEMSLAENTDT